MKLWKTALRFLPLSLVVLFLAGCMGETNLTALDPQGPQAEWLFDNMLLSLYVMAFVSIVVFAIFFIILARFRRKPGDDELPKQVHGNTALEITWTVIPIILLTILAVPTITGTFMLADVEPDPEVEEETVTITVTGHQFWWQFDYEDGFTAGNDVYIPVGEKVIFELHASDVMHSFWVPALGGKVDTIPGITNHLWLEASEPGVYKGKCAELCGASHALMDFKVIALERDDYDAWVEGMMEADAEPDTDDILVQQGYELFGADGLGCIGCHAVGGSGTAAGPTLTNFGDRTTIANFLENNDENLEEWIRNPKALKQGNDMPEFPDVTDEEMEALIAYLRSLSVRELDE
ncbi:cytochrome c oxidase subunit II [Halalkalibacterium halodurans]|jgi:cytochrome c oxidase subunit 2|uniref:Cytochrome c oxidase subunit 2 n=2 Tax=Halalkalibacterium halodurans TaxID=86665 RepID=Q9K9N0_HALH5|nr:cytochrome c oxidase subunit II [Halalkalibacterium halodurans]MDY7223149.1 cytochrome c oxidase subunit II [Halalkalibacterium halodurans]MDY7242370.1 cytochrome c oxidase subunit II [Halalkalibacterium halodurans]MED4079757.1 cytochrome c oxidase subunit II [Halalkalibacterium halodurans]MED4086301.1 cytochrome c oxidase subunit II [Halalkalibacterium halodurans]MED4103354.1 cytochrome c oxidase subunit II [Halalkalibacterium halodurans]